VAKLQGHTDEITAVAVGSLNEIWSASKDGTIKQWNKDGKCIKTINIQIHLKYKDILYHKKFTE